MRVAVELDYPLGVNVKALVIFQNWRPRDIAGHFILELPIPSNLALLGPELLNVFFDLTAVENLLQAV